MNKILLVLLLSCTNIQCQNTEPKYEITGKVVAYIGNEKVKVKDATIELIQTKELCDVDSSGAYKFTGLKKGGYDLRALNFNINPKIFHIEIIDESIVDFNLNIEVDCEFDRNVAKKDLKNGAPKLLLIGGIAPFTSVHDSEFAKKFGIDFYDFGDTSPPIECVEQYNSVIFAYLDKEFGMTWRKEVRPDVIGL